LAWAAAERRAGATGWAGGGGAWSVKVSGAARDSQQRPGRYLDPVSLASPIVAIATLAWTIYNDQRKRTPEPPPSSIARQVRITLRDQDTTLPPGTERITEVIATEITRQANLLR
jgi:hypothetical protein